MKRELDARLEAQLHWSCGTLGTEGQGHVRHSSRSADAYDEEGFL